MKFLVCWLTTRGYRPTEEMGRNWSTLYVILTFSGRFGFEKKDTIDSRPVPHFSKVDKMAILND